MAHNLTETSSYTTNISVPDTGDSRTAASVETPFQGLADRTKWLKDHALLNGHMTEPAYIYYDGAVASIVVAPISRLIIEDAALSTSIESLVDFSSLSGVTGWRYLYVFKSGSSIGFEWSATGPTPDRVFMTGDGTRRFVTSVHFLVGTPSKLFRRERGHIRYYLDRAGFDIGPLTASTFTAQSLADYIPPHSRIGRIEAALNAGEDGAVAYLKTTGAGSSGIPIAGKAMTTPTVPNVHYTCDIITNSSQSIDYKLVDTGSDTPQLFINVLGYYE